MIARDERSGTWMINTAVVPRIQQIRGSGESGVKPRQKRHFCVVELEGDVVVSVQHVYVSVDVDTQECAVVEVQDMIRKQGNVWEMWDDFDERWVPTADGTSQPNQ